MRAFGLALSIFSLSRFFPYSKRFIQRFSQVASEVVARTR
ncbi:hypothetical protein S7335_2386 [Synechococcus sp. PCC 7335]|nr:hypothetical protein S7335_2386 [Synechococcus sp. PCC 7335]